MAGVLLAIFCILILFDTRLALVALVLAIVLLYRKRGSPARKKPIGPNAWEVSRSD